MAVRRAKRGRLSRSAEFERVYRQGRSHANRFLVLYTFPRAGDDQPRVGLSVSRKVGRATVRNRWKRLLREAFRLSQRELPQGVDLVVIPRPEAKPTLDLVRTSLRRLSRKVAQRLKVP